MERLYVIEGKNGLCKVGRTKDWAKRVIGLRKEFAVRGDAIKRFHAFEEIEETFHAERRFIDWAVMVSTECAGGNEWFRGLDFDAAVVAGAKITALFANMVKRTETLGAQMKRFQQAKAKSKAQAGQGA